MLPRPDRDSQKFRNIGESRRVGDAPDLGKVQKFRHGYDPSTPGHRGSRRSRHSSSDRRRRQAERSNQILRRWLVLCLCLAAAGLATLVIWTASRQSGKPSSQAQSTPSATGDSSTEEIPGPNLAELEAAARFFLTSESTDRLSAYHLPTSTPPEKILEFLAESRRLDGPVADVTYLGPIQSLVSKPEGFLVTFKTTRHNRLALLVQDTDGAWKIDYDAYARTCSPDWKPILSGEAKEGLVRIYVARDTYYNGRFKDDRAWTAYSMASPDHDRLMVGYAPKGSLTDRAVLEAINGNLASSLAEGGHLLRMTLKIRRTPSDEARQFEILEAVADDWTVGPESLEKVIGRKE